MDVDRRFFRLPDSLHIHIYEGCGILLGHFIVNSPDPDNSRHPSPGQTFYATPSRFTNNHEVRFEDDDDHNPFNILGENDEDDNGNGGAPSLNMSSLRA